MTCFHPLEAFRLHERNPDTGKHVIKFVYHPKLDILEKVNLPCGQCVGCRLERSRQWAIRCVHESQLHKDNCFITLTYNDENLPEDRSLDIREFQLFMKRLRKKFGEGIRFFHCGEYGEKYGRPHYHACLFNFDFPDKKLWKVVNEQRLYTSDILTELWPFGYSTVGSVTFESAAYVARYIMKKITGDAASAHYEYINPDTGEITQRKPEYTTMSRRPGIAKDWFTKYSSDVYPSDFVVLRGKKMRPPKYYDCQYEVTNPLDFELIKHQRTLDADKFLENNTRERLAVREQVKLAQISKLKRTVD